LEHVGRGVGDGEAGDPDSTELRVLVWRLDIKSRAVVECQVLRGLPAILREEVVLVGERIDKRSGTLVIRVRNTQQEVSDGTARAVLARARE
jgi:hypothetical protein